MKKTGLWAFGLLLAVAGASASCGDGESVAPDNNGTPTLALVGGATGSDTIGTVLVQGLIVEVKGAGGTPLSGIAVRFDALHATDSTGTFPTTFIAPRLSTNFQTFLGDTTDAKGRVVAVVRLAFRTGAGGVVVSIPEFGLTDTAKYTVHPGRVRHVQVAPADTLISVGRPLALTARVLDAAHNLRTDPVTFVLLGGPCTLPSPGTVVGTNAGTCRITARAQTAVDTAFVGIIPAWDVIGATGSEVVKLNLATGERRVVGHTTSREAYPSATRQGFIAYRGGNHMVVIKPDGSRVDPLVKGIVPSWSGWGRLTRNNVAVYFAGDGYIYRATVDGAGLDVVFGGTTPDTSPDGSLAVYNNEGIIHIGNVTNKTFVGTGVAGTLPRWSPTGDRIAYLSGSMVWVMQGDGSDRKVVSRYLSDNTGLDWSEDGQWVVAGPHLIKADGTDQLTLKNMGLSQVSVIR